MPSQPRLTRALTASGAVRVLTVELTAPALEVGRRHDLSGDALRLMSEGMVAAGLLSAHIKGDERVTVQLQGSTPRVALYAEINADGRVRGRLTPAGVSVGGDVKGLMLVVKSVAQREVYRGVTEVEGTLEQALRGHLEQSAQVDAVLAIDVELDGGTLVRAAGTLVERLGVSEGGSDIAGIAAIEVARDLPAAELLGAVAEGRLFDEPLELLEVRPLEWYCSCGRERVLATLASLGDDEVLAMADEDHGAEVSCHFCCCTYRFGEAELRALVVEN